MIIHDLICQSGFLILQNCKFYSCFCLVPLLFSVIDRVSVFLFYYVLLYSWSDWLMNCSCSLFPNKA